MFEIPSWLAYLLIVGTAAILFAHAFNLNEGFNAGQPGIRCGLHLPSCSGGTYCINGFCQTTDTPALPANELSVYP
jgi:hypothetical protein